MISSLKPAPPQSEAELLARCNALCGLSFNQLSAMLGLSIPDEPVQRKGFTGAVIEMALGTDAKNRAAPDFTGLGIELKTLPVGIHGKPVESTFITSIPLLTLHQQTWPASQCYAKLKRVLWLPVEGERSIAFGHRRIGQGFLWSPTPAQEQILADDWNYLSLQICTGQLDSLDASVGNYLQVRPKAAHGKSLCYAYDAEGNKIQTLPRGFYLRSRFTAMLI